MPKIYHNFHVPVEPMPGVFEGENGPAIGFTPALHESSKDIRVGKLCTVANFKT
jgi:hypothetical protein